MRFQRPTLSQTVVSELYWIAIFFVAATVLWYVALSSPRPAETLPFFLTIGVIASWRYSWWLCHQVRANLFLRRRFPRIRHEADSTDGRIDHVYAVVLSYNIPEDVFLRSYQSLITATLQSGVPTTIVASITSDRDRRLLNQLHFAAGSPDQVNIVAQFQDGSGKRAAIGQALRAITRMVPPKRSVTILMDGDTVLGDGAVSRVLPFFAADDSLSAATTNNNAIVDGNSIARNWYALRLAQRHTIMASMALSGKLLVLTGRYSLFRTDIATSPDFISQVEDDVIHHWRLGKIKFLTGDDKSTWFNVLKSGGKMLYIPDVTSYALEELPAPGRFLPASTKLMRRWFGNMLRANGRAVALGPRRLGLFVWWSLVDQRVSIWTSLAGPAATLLLATLLSPVFIVYYLAWALLIRTVMSIAAAWNYGQFSFSWPLLMYYNQIWGAALKSWLSFHLNNQSWTRQAIVHREGGDLLRQASGGLLHAASVGVFILAVGIVTGQLSQSNRDPDWRPGFDTLEVADGQPLTGVTQ